MKALLPVLVAAALLALFPLVGSRFYVDLVLTTMIMAVFALSLAVLAGETGLVSFGHAAFLGVAAYATVLLAPVAAPANVLWLLPAAVLAAAAYALFVGALSLRTRGVYFIMVTLAFAQMAYFVFHDTALGGGSDGTYLNVRPQLSVGGWVVADLDHRPAFYYFAWASLIVTFALLALVKRSRFGHALAGIRVNEQRMRAAGFATYRYKLAAFVLGGALAGVAGFLLAVKDGFVNPELLSWHQSGAVLLMLILGGLGSLRGAVIGAVLFVMLKEVYQSTALFGDFARHWQLLLGITIIVLVALLPRGVMGATAQWRGQKARRARGR